jgi:hypothetical protein
MAVKLQHEDGKNYKPNKVSVQYDGRTANLEVDNQGTVEARNNAEAKALIESHGGFFKVNEDEEADHVLADKNVAEAETYVQDIEQVSRLKELRELEDRKTGQEVIDSRISEVKAEEEDQNDEDEVSEKGEEQDGAQTEDE